jgi:putative heme-binding domain-containing protein
MPGIRLPDMEVWRMAAFVKQLGRQATSESASGDATAGAVIYQQSGCAGCHSIRGQGGYLGPELDDIGAKRAVRHLRQSIVEPHADIPNEYRTVVVTALAGSTIKGIHLNDDEYSVHLRDLGGNLRSFLKKELKGVNLPRESVMPAYASLPQADLSNLVAYLVAQRPGASSRAEPAQGVVWMFDRLSDIGGHKTLVLGEPKVIDIAGGKAVEFDGVDDALFIENHPLAGAETFTIEAIFRPDGGQVEQRWFHLSERDPATGADSNNRMLFEIRVAGDQWFLDSFHQSGSESRALMNRQALHPLGRWHHVATVYDGKRLSNYVDGVEEGAADIRLSPHGPGHTSVGVRINKVFYFKGAVYLARFTRRALPPSEFLKAPGK